MREGRYSRRGFTLIELLIVMLIIIVLSGILFKIASLVSHKAVAGKATADMENIQNALTEYYVEYGIYPPTTNNAYIYECTNWQSTTIHGYLEQTPDFGDSAESGFAPGDHIGYQYGLVSHLFLRKRGGQRDESTYSADTARDKAAKRRWASYLSGVKLKETSQEDKDDEDAGSLYSSKGPTIKDLPQQTYYNAMAELIGPNGKPYSYECRPPYQSYELKLGSE